MKHFLLISLLFLNLACSKNDTSTDSNDSSSELKSSEEIGQQVGEVMSSVDDSGGNTNGSISFNLDREMRTLKRVASEEFEVPFIYKIQDVLIPQAWAASCSTTTFGSCSSNSRIKEFDGCTLARGATITGNITLTFAGSDEENCLIPVNDDSVTRTPDFQIKGLRGATLKVGVNDGASGQTLTRTGVNSFAFSNDGIRRTFTTGRGKKLIDILTETTSDITVTGSARNGRTITGGVLKVTNLINDNECDLSPTDIEWATGCNCPTSGSWSGTCTNGDEYSISFLGECGTAEINVNGKVSEISLDRCN